MARGSTRLSSPLHLLHRAGQRADSLFAQHVGNHAFTPRQFTVLQAVANADGLSQTAIMQATGIDRSGTAELVRRLVSSGLLQRRRTKEDARVYAVRLTPQGRKMLAIGERAARAAGIQLLASIPSRQRAAFITALGSIIDDA
jgi:MarR family transcriptional regulator, temperature-dependent positive regulator of motility